MWHLPVFGVFSSCPCPWTAEATNACCLTWIKYKWQWNQWSRRNIELKPRNAANDLFRWVMHLFWVWTEGPEKGEEGLILQFQHQREKDVPVYFSGFLPKSDCTIFRSCKICTCRCVIKRKQMQYAPPHLEASYLYLLNKYSNLLKCLDCRFNLKGCQYVR